MGAQRSIPPARHESLHATRPRALLPRRCRAPLPCRCCGSMARPVVCTKVHIIADYSRSQS
eukprot:6669057-Prymnesium_polylepis.1